MDICLSPNGTCESRFSYGYSYYCRHPQRAAIIARTLAAGDPSSD